MQFDESTALAVRVKLEGSNISRPPFVLFAQERNRLLTIKQPWKLCAHVRHFGTVRLYCRIRLLILRDTRWKLTHRVAVHSFQAGSSTGPDKFRPQQRPARFNLPPRTGACSCLDHYSSNLAFDGCGRSSSSVTALLFGRMLFTSTEKSGGCLTNRRWLYVVAPWCKIFKPKCRLVDMRKTVTFSAACRYTTTVYGGAAVN